MTVIFALVLIAVVGTPGEGGGGYSPGNFGTVCGPLMETLTLFQRKIRDFPYPISDLIRDFIPYFRPDPYPIVTYRINIHSFMIFMQQCIVSV